MLTRSLKDDETLRIFDFVSDGDLDAPGAKVNEVVALVAAAEAGSAAEKLKLPAVRELVLPSVAVSLAVVAAGAGSKLNAPKLPLLLALVVVVVLANQEPNEKAASVCEDAANTKPELWVCGCTNDQGEESKLKLKAEAPVCAAEVLCESEKLNAIACDETESSENFKTTQRAFDFRKKAEFTPKINTADATMRAGGKSKIKTAISMSARKKATNPTGNCLLRNHVRNVGMVSKLASPFENRRSPSKIVCICKPCVFYF